MSERIDAIYLQVIDEVCENPLYRFAELIVNDCLRMIENEASQYAEPVWAVELVNDIKEHFQIEHTVDDQLRSCSTYFGNNP
jgi:hypothetical protein